MSSVKGLKDTINWYNNNAAQYSSAAKKLYFTAGIEKFTSFLPSPANVLDAGCGSGRDSAILQSMGYHVIGVDISEGLLQEARKQFPEIQFVPGDLLSLPFNDNAFDGIWAHASLVHFETIEDTKRAISEFYRIIKPGGVVHIFVKEKLGNEKTAVVSDKLSNHDRFFQYYTQDEMASLLNDRGFQILFMQDKVIDPARRDDTKWVWTLAKKPN